MMVKTKIYQYSHDKQFTFKRKATFMYCSTYVYAS